MTWLRNAMLAAILGFSMLSIAPPAAQADDYWDGYWGWYDNTYTPAYGRYYTARPAYRSGYYREPYYGGPYYDGYYARPYYGEYYGTPRAGVQIYGGGRAVNVGPVRFGWR